MYSQAVTFFRNGTPPSNVHDILTLDLDGSQAAIMVQKLSQEIDIIKQELSETEKANTDLKKNLYETTKNLREVQSQFMFYKNGNLPANISGKFVKNNRSKKVK